MEENYNMCICVTKRIESNREPRYYKNLYDCDVEHFFKSLNTEVFNYWDLIKKYNLDKLFKNDKMYSCEKAIHKLEILKDYIMPDEFDRCIKVLEKHRKVNKSKIFFYIWWR